MNSSRKGQAAFEYLVTYGWAFVVIIAAIGVLSYFGLLSPQRYIPDTCEFGEQLNCVDYLIVNQVESGANGYIILRLRNNFEQDIKITGATDLTGNISLHGPTPLPVVISRGEIRKVELEIADTITVLPKDKQRYKINLQFSRDSAGAPSHNVSGTLFAEVVDVAVIGDQV